MRNKIMKITAILAVMMAMIGVANANGPQTFDLNYTNFNNIVDGSVHVIVTTDPANKQFTVKSVSYPADLTFKDIILIAYNPISNTCDPISPIWKHECGGQNHDGFGTFNTTNKWKGNEGLEFFPTKFTLKELYLNMDPNNNGANMVMHIRFEECTGFISNVPTTSKDTHCTTTQIPEFATVAIPIAAVLGLVFFFQQRKKKEE